MPKRAPKTGKPVHDIEQAVNLCELAYQDQKYSATRLKLLGFKDCEFFSNGVQAFVADGGPHHRDRWLVFRGTELDVRDWLTNFDVARVKTESGEIHQGFLHALLDLWPDISACVLKNLSDTQRLLITGHSQGGALANIAAVLLSPGVHSDSLITFGCPRVGDGRFAKSVAKATKRHIRCVNNNDVVARIPIPLPSSFARTVAWFLRGWGVKPQPLQTCRGYRHADAEIVYFTEDGGVIINPPRWTLFRDRLKGRWCDLFELGSDSAKDHFLKAYIPIVEHNVAIGKLA